MPFRMSGTVFLLQIDILVRCQEKSSHSDFLPQL